MSLQSIRKYFKPSSNKSIFLRKIYHRLCNMHAFYPSIVSHRTGSEEARKIRLYKNLIKYHHEKWKSKGKKSVHDQPKYIKKLFLEQQKKFFTCFFSLDCVYFLCNRKHPQLSSGLDCLCNRTAQQNNIVCIKF